jgi:lipoprotein-anchoring transpeptidase ErfK/SrfK
VAPVIPITLPTSCGRSTTTTAGDAIHTNYWKAKDVFGIPTSHGCVGMPEPDAHWIWNFATVGTPMVLHF